MIRKPGRLRLDQIPKEFFTPEFLLIEATGYRETVLESIVENKRLDLLPANYAVSESWNSKTSSGATPREILELLLEREAKREVSRAESEANLARARSEPATEKQKEKLRFYGYALNEEITKGEASDALDKCAREFPEVNHDYYNRPATEEQLARIREINEHPDCGPDEPFYDFENEGPLTYGAAKDLIQEWGWLRRQKEREDLDRESLIGCVARTDFFPQLTYGRVEKAAKCLDQINPEWMEGKDRHNVLLRKVAELNPELAEKDGWLRVLLEK
jgi:hypothetical protein